MRKLSLHFGLNTIDNEIYKGKYRKLINSINDAVYYQSIASKKGFSTSLFTDKSATKDSFSRQLTTAAAQLEAGDYLLITYSGHGTFVKDLNGDETDGRDEALVLYDGILLDDTIYELWTLFKEGVRILLITDSCYNATVIRLKNFKLKEKKYLKSIKLSARFLETFQNKKPISNKTPKELKCSLIHLASSSDGGQSNGGSSNTKLSTYTYNLSLLLKNNGFEMTCKEIQQYLFLQLQKLQKPEYNFLGKENAVFENAKFLT